MVCTLVRPEALRRAPVVYRLSDDCPPSTAPVPAAWRDPRFLSPVDRAWRTKAKVKARLLGDSDPDEWDLPPKPKGMRLRTYERLEAKYDRAEEALDYQLCIAVGRLLKL